MVDVIKCVKDSLREAWRADYTETSLGWLSIKNKNILLGPKYLISINFPIDDLEIDYISRYSLNSDMDIVHKIYKSCNGISLFGGRFYIPGVRAGLKPKDALDYFNIPYDMDVCSGSEYPAYAPVLGLVIGMSWRRFSGEDRPFHDILDSSGSILSGFFFHSSEIHEKHHSIENWISNRSRESMSHFVQDAKDECCLSDFPSLLRQ